MKIIESLTAKFIKEDFKVVDKRNIWLGTHPKHGNLGILIYLNIKSSHRKFDTTVIRVHSIPTVRGGVPLIDFEDIETLSIDEALELTRALKYAVRIATTPFILIDPSVPIPK